MLVVEGVLFDRDGTLVHDEPYNGDPDRVRPMLGASAALDRLRSAGLKIGMVSNQSGIARKLVTAEQVARVNARLAGLVGPFDTIQICPHEDVDGCECRKPRPGLILAAAVELGIPPRQLAVIGDIGADIGAAQAAGARGILVPGPTTRREEIARAAPVARSLSEATELVLSWAGRT